MRALLGRPPALLGPRSHTDSPRPLVIAHRGASGYRPEHTLESYGLAIDLGADYIEPDLVITADGVLVARHEAELSTSTDVASRPEFAHLRRTKSLDGREVTGWFVEDFTVDEIKTLWARERLAQFRHHSSMYDDRYRIPTFAEIAALAARSSGRLNRLIGVYPELKHPTHFAMQGLRHDEPLLSVVDDAQLDRSQVFVQCFEPSALRRLAAARTSLSLVQLINVNGRPYDWEHHGHGGTFADMLTPAGIGELSTYASGVGVHKSLVIPRDPDGRLSRPSGLVQRARQAGMKVHAWTFRNENAFLPADHRRGEQASMFGNAFGEYAAYIEAGVDGIFTDHPDTAVTARQG